jgi:protein-S-isoprenylcysteine O-methyltransferase Ste14
LSATCLSNDSAVIVIFFFRAVATLGSGWQVGQDEGDTTRVYVGHGPYRCLHHPMYVGMAISAFGQMLLTAADLRGLIQLLGTMAYGLIQGRAESRRWSNRTDDKRGCP